MVNYLTLNIIGISMIQKEVLEDITAEWADDINKETVIERELATALESTIKQEEVRIRYPFPNSRTCMTL